MLTSVELEPAGLGSEAQSPQHQDLGSSFGPSPPEGAQRGWRLPFALSVHEQSSANQVFHHGDDVYKGAEVGIAEMQCEIAGCHTRTSSSTSATVSHLQPCRTKGQSGISPFSFNLLQMSPALPKNSLNALPGSRVQPCL